VDDVQHQATPISLLRISTAWFKTIKTTGNDISLINRLDNGHSNVVGSGAVTSRAAIDQAHAFCGPPSS